MAVNRPVRIAMLDSGVSIPHSHIRRSLQGGVTILENGEEAPGYKDQLGHGTAVCALMQELAPYADLYSVRIFDRQLTTSLSVVLRGIRWCIQHEIDIINLSLGTTNAAHGARFAEVIDEANAAGAILVSAYEAGDTAMLPGSMPRVIGVSEDFEADRYTLKMIAHPTLHFGACPYPLDIPGIARERNLHGVSFSVAHTSARIASLWPWSTANSIANQLATQAYASL